MWHTKHYVLNNIERTYYDIINGATRGGKVGGSELRHRGARSAGRGQEGHRNFVRTTSFSH